MVQQRFQNVLCKWVRAEFKLRSKTNRLKQREGEKEEAKARINTISFEISELKTRIVVLSEQKISDQDTEEGLEGEMRNFTIIHVSSKEDIEFLGRKGVYNARLSMADCSFEELLALLPICENYGLRGSSITFYIQPKDKVSKQRTKSCSKKKKKRTKY